MRLVCVMTKVVVWFLRKTLNLDKARPISKSYCIVMYFGYTSYKQKTK